MTRPLFSIITASFNSEKTIKKTISSVLEQSFSDFEYIIIDGKSTDTTIEIIASFALAFKKRKINFFWISEKDTGIYDAFNKGIKKAKGNWISFLGADDCYLKNALEWYFSEIKVLKNEIDLIYSNIQVEEKKIIRGQWSWNRFRRKMTIAHVGAFHAVAYFKKHGLFKTSYKIAGDYELLLRAKENLKTHKVNKITVIMSSGGISNRQIEKAYIETTRAKIETGNVNSTISKIDYTIWILKYNVKKIIYAFVR